MPISTLVWRDVPPSLNRQGRTHPQAQARLKKALQSTLEGLLMANGLPRDLNRIEAWAVLRFPRAGQRRDEGNFRWLLEKALGDALTNGRWLPDDSADQFRFYLLRFDKQPGPAQTTVFLRWGEPDLLLNL